MSQVHRIGVVGSGTAGLAVAINFTRDGQDVSLFERFEEPGPLGAGVKPGPDRCVKTHSCEPWRV